MAFEVASTTTDTITDTGSLVLTKPAGLAVGDLMVAVLFRSDGNTFTTKSGWTLIHNIDPTSIPVTNVQYKFADSSDVAASDFEFDTAPGSPPATGGALYRITDTATTGSVAIADSATRTRDGGGTVGNGTLTVGSTLSQNALADAFSIIITSAHGRNASGYSISVTGPTTDGYVDVLDQIYDSVDEIKTGYLVTTSLHDITAVDFDYTDSGFDDHALSVVVVSSTTSADGNHTQLQNTATANNSDNTLALG